MNLNDLELFKETDQSNMIDKINSLPDQLETAYKLGLEHDLPESKSIKRVLIAGMGGKSVV